MKSSIAAPSFRNSGFETTSNGCDVPPRDRLPDAVRGADRHGDLVDHDAVAVHRAADRGATASTPRDRPSRPHARGVPTAMKQTRDFRTASARSVGEREPALALVAPQQLFEPRLVDRELALRGAARSSLRRCRRRSRRCRIRRSTCRPPGRRIPSRSRKPSSRHSGRDEVPRNVFIFNRRWDS